MISECPSCASKNLSQSINRDDAGNKVCDIKCPFCGWYNFEYVEVSSVPAAKKSEGE